jgi:hypothetical protein
MYWTEINGKWYELGTNKIGMANDYEYSNYNKISWLPSWQNYMLGH